MRKGVVLLIVLTLMSISIVSAVSTDIKESYLPEENMILKIGGNILEPISPEDVEFKRGNVAVPVNFDLKNLGGDYYLWAIAPRSENNYTLRINDVSTTKEGRVVEEDYIANFSVTGDLVEYRINPGFIYTNKDFDVNIFLNRDEDVEINVEFTESEDVVLEPGENTISFEVENVEETELLEITIGDYVMPAYVIVEDGVQKTSDLDLRFNPRIIESKVIAGKQPDYPFSIINFGGVDVENVEFLYNDELFTILPEGSFNVSYGNEEFFVLSLNEEIENSIEEEIILIDGNKNITMDVMIEVVEEEDEQETPYLEGSDQESRNFYCNELTGTICTAEEYCDGEEQPTIDGTCCLGTCVERTNWVAIIIGVLIIVGLGIGGYFIYKKYKKAGSFGDILGRKVKKDYVKREDLNVKGLP